MRSKNRRSSDTSSAETLQDESCEIQGYKMEKRINVKDWGIYPNESDCSLKLRNLLDDNRQEENVILEFETGEYHFYPDYAEECLLCVSNHDEDTIKRVAFNLTGYRGLQIQGNSSLFRFHTDILPFWCHDCAELELEGVRIDYARPAYSEGVVLEVTPERMRFGIDPERYPYHISHGRLYFTGENYCHELTYWMEVDAERMGPIRRKPDFFFNQTYGGMGASFAPVQEGVVEMTLTNGTFSPDSKPGNRLVLRHHPRNYPAVYVTDSRNVCFRDVAVCHCEGMAFTAQFTENILLERFNVTRPPENDRVFSAAADATHFVYCKGKIHVKDCLMENQLDDPMNVHGIYFRIREVLSDREVIAELVHHQQKGVPLGYPKDRIAVINRETLLKKEEAALENVRVLNKDYCIVRFDRKMEQLQAMDVLENQSWVPDVLVEGCTFRNNRARGLLLTSAGEVTIRKNYFHVPGAAILIEGDANNWFESGATSHILLEDNCFDNCAYVSDWGKAPIQVSARAEKLSGEERYHKCLEIRKNKFICFDERLVNVKNLEKLIFEGNEIVKSSTFPPKEGRPFELEAVNDFVTDEREQE